MSQDPLPQRLGEHELVEQIGRGPYCRVWRSRRAGGCEYALKALEPRYVLDPARVARFEEEARLAQSFEHPNIVRVHEVVPHQDAPLPFFVMDLLTGGNLARFCRAEARGLKIILGLVAEVAGALDYLHGRDLVHCDVKPSNILLDGAGRPYLTDFGMTASPEDLEQAGPHGGTILYMSPEQLASLSSSPAARPHVDARSDIYSLGVLLYDLLTGELPFKGGSRHALLYKRITSEPRPPSRLRAEIGPDLDRVILKAMAREPADRFASVAALVRELRALAA